MTKLTEFGAFHAKANIVVTIVLCQVLGLSALLFPHLVLLTPVADMPGLGSVQHILCVRTYHDWSPTVYLH